MRGVQESRLSSESRSSEGLHDVHFEICVLEMIAEWGGKEFSSKRTRSHW